MQCDRSDDVMRNESRSYRPLASEMDGRPDSKYLCGLCCEPYSDPRVLPCMHTFCRGCLEKTLEVSAGSKQNITCQEQSCQKCFELPEEGTKALPQDLRLELESLTQSCVQKVREKGHSKCEVCMKESNGPAVVFCCSSDCRMFLCQRCKEYHEDVHSSHKLIDVTDGNPQASDEIHNSLESPQVLYCSEQRHQQNVLGFYCLTCQTLVCHVCLQGKKHKDHSIEEIGDVARQHRSEMEEQLQPTEEAVTALERAIHESKLMEERVEEARCKVRSQIEQKFDDIEDILQKRKEALFEKCDSVTSVKAKNLRERSKCLTDLKARMEGCKDKVEQSLKLTDEEVVGFRHLLQDHTGSLLGEFDSLSPEIGESGAIPSLFDTSSLVEEINQFGTVSGGCSPAHSTARLHIPGAVRGRKRRILVEVRTESGEPFKLGGEEVGAEIRLKGSSDKPILGKAANNGDGTYVVSFTPQDTGKHDLSITICNQQIKGSPFTILVREPRDYASLSSIPRKVFTDLGRERVYAFALHHTGEMYVTQYHYLRILKPDGSSKAKIGRRGSGREEFLCPYGIAIRGEHIFIVENDNHRVKKLTLSGKYVSHFGSRGTTNGQFQYPRAIAIDPDGHIFVSDCQNNRVQVFEVNARYLYSIPQDDQSLRAQIPNPWGLAFDPVGNLHVACDGTQNIKVFTPDGRFIGEYGEGCLRRPAGIAIDEEGYVFVTEYNSTDSRLQIFSPSHTVIKSVTGFNNARSVALGEDGSVYVGDQNHYRILKY